MWMDSYWILRTFQTGSALLMLTLFKSIVLSRIDYGHPTKKDIYVNLREYNDRLQSIFLGCKIYHIIRD